MPVDGNQFARLGLPGGLDAVSGPNAVPRNRAIVLENFLTDRPGKLVPRGPLELIPHGYDYNALTGDFVTGLAAHDTTLLLGYTVSSGLSPFGVPTISATTQPTAVMDVFVSDPNTGKFTLTNPTVRPGNILSTYDAAPGPRAQRYGKALYIVSAWSPTTIATPAGGEPARKLLVWLGGGGGISEYTNAPRGAVDIAVYKERLFMLGGTAASSPLAGPYLSSCLRFSDPLASSAGSTILDQAAVWQDDITGLDNLIVVNPNENDYGTAMCVIDNGLAIFCRKSIWVLRGSGSSSFSVKQFSNQIGCSFRESVIPYDSGTVFANEDGFWYFDGSQLVELSKDIADLWRPLAAVKPKVVAARLRGNYVLLTFTDVVTAKATQLRRSFLIHVPTRTWSEVIAPTQGSLPVAMARMDAANGQWTVGDNRSQLMNLNQLTDPGYTGSLGREPNTSGVNQPIVSRARYRSAQLATPGYKAQLRRIMLDYKAFQAGGTAPPAPWTVKTYDNANNVLTTNSFVWSTAATAGEFMRGVAEAHKEMDNVYTEITYTGGVVAAGTITSLELHDLSLMFTTGRPRRGT